MSNPNNIINKDIFTPHNSESDSINRHMDMGEEGETCTLSEEFDTDEIIRSLHKQVCVLQKHIVKQDKKLKFLCKRVEELECKNAPVEYQSQNFEAMLHIVNKKFDKMETSINSLSNVVYRSHGGQSKAPTNSKNCRIVRK